MSTTLRRVVLADPHPLWLDAIENVLRAGDVEVVAQSSPGPEALAALEESHPDLLVTELATGNGDLDALAYIREARERFPETKIVVLAAAADVQTVQNALLAGASAYVVKEAHPEDLLAAIRQAFDGLVFIAPSELLGHLPQPSANEPEDNGKLAKLTRRELEVLQLVADGLTNAQLARILWVSEQTVKFHLSNIYRKLEVANRTEASRWAHVHGALVPASERAGA